MCSAFNLVGLWGLNGMLEHRNLNLNLTVKVWLDLVIFTAVMVLVFFAKKSVCWKSAFVCVCEGLVCPSVRRRVCRDRCVRIWPHMCLLADVWGDLFFTYSQSGFDPPKDRPTDRPTHQPASFLACTETRTLCYFKPCLLIVYLWSSIV